MHVILSKFMDIVAQMTNVIVPDLAKFENLKVEKSLEKLLKDKYLSVVYEYEKMMLLLNDYYLHVLNCHAWYYK